MTGVITDLRSLVQTGDVIRESINRWYDISGKLKLFYDQLGRLNDRSKFWETQITKFGLENDEVLLCKIRVVKSILDVEKSRLFGKNDDRRVPYSTKFKLWFSPAKLESSIQKVTSFCDDLSSSLIAERDIGSRFRDRLLQAPSKLSFSSDHRYIPLKQTEEKVKTALKHSGGPPVILLHGRSGTGKSALARNLALNFQKEIQDRNEGHASCSQQGYTSGPVFDRVIYMECGPDVTLPTKQRELAQQLDPFAISTIATTGADVQDKWEFNNLIIKLLSGLLKCSPFLIILDDVWECQGESSRGRGTNFLQGMVSLGGERVKWLVTSQSQRWNIKGSYPIGMEEVKREDGRRILAALAGLEESDLIPEIKDIMDGIVIKTCANLLAMTCVASTVSKERCKQKEEWKRVERDLSDALNSPDAIQIQGIGHRWCYWGAIRVSFDHLSRAQKNLLILIHMCEGPSVSSDVVEYLFQQTRHGNWCEAFSRARDTLQGRNLLTIETTSDPTWGDKERWSIHDLLRKFITRAVFGGLAGRVPIVDTLAKEEIFFEKGPNTIESEHEVVVGVASLYFGNNFGCEFAEKLGIPSWTPKVTNLRRQVIDPIAHLLGLTEDEQWTSALHACISQVLLKYVKHTEFDDSFTSSLLNSPISKIPILCSLYTASTPSSYSNYDDPLIGRQTIHALFSLLEGQITLVIGPRPNSLSPSDCTLLVRIAWVFGAALESQDKINISDLNDDRWQTMIEQLVLGLRGVQDSLHSVHLVEISHESEKMSFNNDVRVPCINALASLAYGGGGGIKEKMIDCPEFLKSLVKAMRTKDSPSLQEQAARSIDNLAVGLGTTEIMGSKIVDYPGVLDALVDGLNASENQPFQRNSALALANLAGIPGDQIKWKIIRFEGALKKLIFAVRDVDDHEVKKQSARAIANLAKGGRGVKEKMIDCPELLESLVKAMRTKDSPHLQEEAARFILNLAAQPGSPPEIMGLKIVHCPGVLDALVDGLDTSKNQLFQRNSAWALANLAEIPGDQIKWKIIMFEGALRKLIFAMHDVDDHEVKKQSARALASLAKGGRGIKENMIDCPELLESLVKAMRTKDSPILQEQAARSIDNLAARSGSTEIMGVKILDYLGVLEALVDGLDASENQPFQRNSARALANLTGIPGDQITWKIIMFEGALRKLIFAMHDVDDHEVKKQSARALANLACGGAGIQEKMIDFPELLERLVKAMRTKDSPHLQAEAARSIDNLAAGPGITEIMGLKIVHCPGVLDALVDGIDTFENQPFQRNSAWALANLAQIPGDQIKWKIAMFEGALRKLIFAVRDVDDHEVKKQSAKALANLAYGGGGIKEKMIDCPELLESLVKAMRTKDLPVLQEQAALSIDNLAAGPGITEIMGLKIVGYPGVLDALVDGLDASENQPFQRNSAWAVANLAGILGDQITWKIIMFEGALRKLIFGIVNADDNDVKKHCARAIRNIIFEGDNDMRMKVKIDFPQILDVLESAVARDETYEGDMNHGMAALTLLDPLRAKVIQVDSAAMYLGRGCGELSLGLYKDACEDLDRYEAMCALEQNPNAGNVFSWRCCAKAKLGDLQGALADANSLFGLECEAFALQERGVVKCMLGDLGGALEDLNASLRLSDEDDYEVLKHRGFVHFLMSDEECARADAERAIRCKPSRVDVANYGLDFLGGSSIQYLEFELR